MKLEEFTYTKDNQASLRRVFVFQNAGDYIEGIDTTRLDQIEIKEVTEIIEKYDRALAPFVAKAYRKFKKSQIVPLSS
jgi:hypothetical protein